MSPDDVTLARRLAVEAGERLMALREQRLDRWSDHWERMALGDEADALAQEVIADGLAHHRPHDALLSEEGRDSRARLDADRVWIVDPLDGTWEYTSGTADFAVHVALWERSRPVDHPFAAAVVDLPARGVTHVSHEDGDSTPHDVVAAPPLPEDRPVRLVVSRGRTPYQLPALVHELRTEMARTGRGPHGVEVISVGSVGAKVGEILAGRADAYVSTGTLNEWDLAAPAAVARARGYDVCAADGRLITFNQRPPSIPDVVISHPELLEALLRGLGRGGADRAEGRLR